MSQVRDRFRNGENSGDDEHRHHRETVAVGDEEQDYRCREGKTEERKEPGLPGLEEEQGEADQAEWRDEPEADQRRAEYRNHRPCSVVVDVQGRLRASPEQTDLVDIQRERRPWMRAEIGKAGFKPEGRSLGRRQPPPCPLRGNVDRRGDLLKRSVGNTARCLEAAVGFRAVADLKVDTAVRREGRAAPGSRRRRFGSRRKLAKQRPGIQGRGGSSAPCPGVRTREPRGGARTLRTVLNRAQERGILGERPPERPAGGGMQGLQRQSPTGQ